MLNKRNIFLVVFALAVLQSVALCQTRKSTGKAAAARPVLRVIHGTSDTGKKGWIAIENEGDSIDKVRITREDGNFSVSQDIESKSSISIEVELTARENFFNLLGYKDNRIVYSSPTPIMIRRTGAAGQAAPDPNPNPNPGAGANPQSKVKIKKLVEKGPQVTTSPEPNVSIQPDFNVTAGKGPAFYRIEVQYEDKTAVTKYVDVTPAGGGKAQPVDSKVVLKAGVNTVVVAAVDKDFAEIAGYRDVLEVFCSGRCKADEPNKLRIVADADDETLARDSLTLELTSPDDWPDGATIEAVNTAGGRRRTPITSPLNKDASGKVTPKQSIQIPLHEGTNSIEVKILKNGAAVTGFIAQSAPIKCRLACGKSGPTARALIGFEQIGASSTEGKGSPFLDFYFDAAIRKKLSIWSSIRLSSIPIQTIVGFGTIGQFSTFLNSEQKTNELTQSFDFRIGIDIPILKKGSFGNGFLPGRTSVHLIGGVGAINPLSSQKTAQIFTIPAKGNVPFEKLFPELPDTYKHIAFVSPDNIRFYRQYFGGFRMKTSFYKQDGTARRDVFPAIVDITAGQNEAITGILKGVILRAEGSTPLPIKDGLLTIIGGAQVRLGKGKRDRERNPLFLAAAPNDTKLSDNSTFIVPFDQNPNATSNRDTFRIGIGVDLIKIFKDSQKP